MFFDIQATLFDVQDNRQLAVLKRYLSVFGALQDDEFALSISQRARASRFLRQIASVDSYESLYQQLNFHYVIDSTGTLRCFRDESYDVIVSSTVLEHIKKHAVPTFIQDLYRVLRPGGYSIHSIDISDHLQNYDKSVSRKEYLRFSDTVWKMIFQNEVQYINRVQQSEWLFLFNRTGFKLINKGVDRGIYRGSGPTGMGSLRLHRQFRHLDKEDIECTALTVVHQRPSSS